jgi:hypothetical protein
MAERARGTGAVAPTPAARATKTGRSLKAIARRREEAGAELAEAVPKRGSAPPLPMAHVLYDATITPDVVDVPERSVVSIDGVGAPEADAFQRAVGALYGVAYTLKHARRRTGMADFKIGPLEGRWWAEGAPEAASLAQAPRETWRWRLRIAVPDDVGAAEVEDAVHEATTKKRGSLEGSPDAARVKLERVAAQRFGRVLHVGPYVDEPVSIARIRAALGEAGLEAAGPHVEVYLGDPRATAPERLKTELLLELAS